MLTKQSIQNMEENQLCLDVIIPLLRSMGFKDVNFYHGGIGEQGKDIVCCKENVLGVRKNYALVVKTQNITGQANTRKGSAGEVATQIQQVFGKDYLDPVTIENREIHECWVITNQKILKEAELSIKAILRNSNLDRLITFIDGQKLWDYVEQYLSIRTVLGRLANIQNELDVFDTHYRPEFQIAGKELHIELKEKFEGASKQKPIEINATFRFPQTPEGILAKEKFEKHFSTGTPVNIPAEFIQSIEFPDFIKPLLGLETLGRGKLYLGPTTNNHHFIAQIEVTSDDGDSIKLEYIDFKVKQIGTEEATLNNVEQNILLRSTLVLKPTSKTITMNFSWKLTNSEYPASQLLELFSFQQCISKPYTIRLVSKEFGIVIFKQHFDQGVIDPPHPSFLKTVKALVKIQKRINKPILIPTRKLAEDEIYALDKITKVVQDGKIVGSWSEFSVELTELSPGILKALNELRAIRLSGTESENLFRTEILLGPVEALYKDAIVGNYDEVKKAFEEGRNISLHFIAKNGKGYCEFLYPDWACKTV